MKNIFKAGICFFAFASFAANASLFEFSYTFSDNSAVTGYLSGNLNGSYVENISDTHVFFNGTEFSGAPLFSSAWNTATQDWDNSIDAIVSPNAALNNFLFADANVPTDYNLTNYFYFVNDSSSLGHEAFANNLNNGDIALDNPTNNSWALVDVPEPATYPLFMAGFALIVAARRRRHQN